MVLTVEMSGMSGGKTSSFKKSDVCSPTPSGGSKIQLRIYLSVVPKPKGATDKTKVPVAGEYYKPI